MKDVLDFLGVEDKPGEQVIHCPFHEDTNPSASVNVSKRMFNCFSSCGGFSFDQIRDKISTLHDVNTSNITESRVADSSTLLDLQSTRSIEEELSYRNLSLEDVTGVCDFSMENGIMLFTDKFEYYQAKHFREDKPYITKPGKKKLFFHNDYSESGSYIILVEGIFDLIALGKCGFTQCASTFGCSVPPELLFQLRDKTTYILFDNDLAGFKGARDVKKKLRDIGANAVVVDMRGLPYKDPDEAVRGDPEAF